MIGTSAFATITKVEAQAKRLVKTGDLQMAKDLVEATLKKFEFEEPCLFFVCGEANLKLGYLMIAEQMFTKCLAYPTFEAKSLKQLG